MKIFDPRTDPLIQSPDIYDDQINFEEDQWCLRISWDNRKVKTSGFVFWFMLIFLLVWFPITCFTTAMIFVSDDLEIFLILWSTMAWLGTFGVIYSLLTRLNKQWIEIDKSNIAYGWSGPLGKREKKFPVSLIAELALGIYSNRGTHESMISINIYESSEDPYSMKTQFKQRHMIAYWLSEDNKKMVFERISKFIADNNIDVKVTTYG